MEALPKQLRGTDLSTAQKAWRWLISAVSEGGEEPVQGLISEMTAKAAYAANKPYFSTTDEYAVVNPGRMVREFGYGMAVGGILGGVPMASAKAMELARRTSVDNAIPKLQQAIQTRVDSVVPDLQQKNSASYVDAETQNTTPTMESEPIKVGRASVLKNPYIGKIPVYYETPNRSKPVVTAESVQVAENSIRRAKSVGEVSGKSYKNSLTDWLEEVFTHRGGAHDVVVNGLGFDGEIYKVTVHKSAIGKLVSDKNMSAGKLAVLDVLDEVISNGEYVGSNQYIQKGKKQKDTIRFDLFETLVTIQNKDKRGKRKNNDYIVAFDVEVFPSSNNYRTHKVIHEMDLTPVHHTDTGTDQPQGSENRLYSI